MPGNTKQKHYAVSIGRGGPMIYNTWDECKQKVSRFPNAEFKSFTSRQSAEEWLKSRAIHGDISSMLQGETHKMLEEQAPPNAALCSTATANTNDVKLSQQQEQILEQVRAGRSVFFTGSAGTGKSVLLRAIINHFGSRPSERLAITASTGIAAVNIGGCTLHSWAGIGLGEQSAKNLAGKFWGQSKFRPVRDQWQDVETLIIDEISMIDGRLFDKLEQLARLMRHSPLPFGGIQLVLSGDFCQLPPVPGRDAKGEQIPAAFAFEAESWDDCVGSPIILTKVFRQKDQAFVDMLNALRFGKTSPGIIQAFKRLSRPVMYTDGIEPMELFPTRFEVENANNLRLSQLTVKTHIYNAKDTPGTDSNGQGVTIAQMERLLERLVAQKELELKVGAQVMLIKNLVQGELVNGSLGKIIGFKSMEPSDDPNQRVAHARSRPSDIWPVVQFTNGREMTVVTQEFTINNASGEIEAMRSQVPLILAYALSVHKSQGQTLERVKIDLRRTFEKGQAYVALSRATAMDRLQVLNFDPDKIVAHPRVLEWHGITEEDEEIIELSDSDDYDAW